MDSTKRLKIILDFVDNASGGLRSAIAAAESSLGGAAKVAGATASSFAGGMKSMAGDIAEGAGTISSHFGTIGTVFSTVGGILGKVGGTVVSGFSGLVGAIGNGAKSIIGSFGNISSNISLMDALVTTVFAKVGGDVLGLAAKFERFGVATKFLTGSTEEANKFAASVKNLAVQTIFGIDEIAELETRLVGNTRSVGASEKALRALLDATAATGGGYQEAASAVRAWIQTNSKAVASSEELNRQFANANIPVLRSLAEAIVKDVNNPLRQYLDIAGEGGGATGVSKKLATAFQSASDQLPILAKRSEAAEMRLKTLKDEGKENTAAFKTAEASVMSYHQQLDKAQQKIGDYTSAQANAGKTTVSTAKLTVDGVMSQLQNLGDLKIPGKVMADAITDALNQSFGGANKELMNSFTGQLEMLKDQLKLTGLAFIGLDKNFNATPGGIFATLTSALRGLNDFLLKNQSAFADWGKSIGSSVPALFAIITPLVVFFATKLGGLGKILFKMLGPWAILGYVLGIVVDKFGLLNDVGGKIDWIKGKFAPLLDFIGKEAGRFAQITDDVREQIAGRLFPSPDEFSKANSSWGNLFKSVYEKYGQPFVDRIGQIVQEAKNKFVFGGGDIGNVQASWSQVFTALVIKVKEKVQEIKNLFVFGDVAPPQMATWTEVFSKLKDIATDVGNVLKRIGDFLIQTFTPAWDGLKKAWEDLQPVAKNFMDAMGPLMPFFGQLAAGIAVLAGIILAIVTSIVVGIITTLGPIISFVVTLVAGIIETVTGFFTLLYGLFTGNGELIKAGWNALWTGIWTLVDATTTKLNNILKAFVDGVIGFFKALYNALVGKSIVPDIVNGIIGWITSLKDKALGLVDGLVSGFKEKFLGLVSAAKNWGKDIIHNIVGGIKDAVNAAGKLGATLLSKMGISMSDLNYAHGGIIPGNIGDAVPITAHAGERIVPRSGADAGDSFGGGSPININISGSFTIDDPARIQQLATQIGKVLGRQQELAQYGAGY